jgi:hypothetical protein
MSSQSNDDLASLRAEVNQMAGGLFGAISVPFEQTSELQRQVLASFTFGMIFAVGRLKGLKPPEVHALVIACLTDVFKYENDQASAFSSDLVSAASGQGNPTTKAIIHRGIDGHAQWQRGDVTGLRTNLQKIFQTLGA